MELKQDRPAPQWLPPESQACSRAPSRQRVRVREQACLARDAQPAHRDWKALRAIAGTSRARQTTFLWRWRPASTAMNRVQFPETAPTRSTDRRSSRRCQLNSALSFTSAAVCCDCKVSSGVLIGCGAAIGCTSDSLRGLISLAGLAL